jgi:hypothetical protein
MGVPLAFDRSGYAVVPVVDADSMAASALDTSGVLVAIPLLDLDPS